MPNDAQTKPEPQTDLEIAHSVTLAPIVKVAEKLGIPNEHVVPYGHYKAKIALPFIRSLEGRREGKLILVSGISPTPTGEGKTTTTVGLGDALNLIGKKAIVALREPALGPCFGLKGGAAGGGYAQVAPMEDINLHFTGDFHAITSAHNLLAAMIDNHIYWGNELGIDARRITWQRVVDLNDRALRSIVNSLGGTANGFPREDGFDITVASEVMAIFCLAESVSDLKARLGRIVVAETRDRKPVTAADLKAHGAMATLLKDALQPNLVQTLEHNPAFVHGGPFANIAHGCNSVTATRTAMRLADYVVTEAGFGADLGAEKFFDIKCRKAGLKPAATVLVATVRALKMHGGIARPDLGKENLDALRTGAANLERHIENVRRFGVPVIVGINRFNSDTDKEIALLRDICGNLGVEIYVCTHWADGGKGAEGLARAVVPMMMRASRSSRSCGSVARQRIAMISLAGVITNRSSRVGPLAVPPRPTTICRSARSFMSMVRGQLMRRLSIWSALPWWMWLSIKADSRLCAELTAWKSPVKWRLMSSIGTTWA